MKMKKRLLKVNIKKDPCEVCGDLDTALYEDIDGAIVVACCQRHAEIAMELENEAAGLEIASLLIRAPNALEALK
jgi:hypothetical protein